MIKFQGKEVTIIEDLRDDPNDDVDVLRIKIVNADDVDYRGNTLTVHAHDLQADGDEAEIISAVDDLTP